MRSLYDVAMAVCRVRDIQEPIWKGIIQCGICRPGEFKPGTRKTMLKDAKGICERNHARLNEAINRIYDHDKLYSEALEMLETWVKVLRRGDMGDISPVMDEIFDTEDLIKKIREGFPT